MLVCCTSFPVVFIYIYTQVTYPEGSGARDTARFHLGLRMPCTAFSLTLIDFQQWIYFFVNKNFFYIFLGKWSVLFLWHLMYVIRFAKAHTSQIDDNMMAEVDFAVIAVGRWLGQVWHRIQIRRCVKQYCCCTSKNTSVNTFPIPLTFFDNIFI